MAFGSWLKSKRQAKKISQKAIADQLNYSSAQFISNWERDLSVPPMHIIPMLAKLLDVSELEIKQEIVKYKKTEIEKLWLA